MELQDFLIQEIRKKENKHHIPKIGKYHASTLRKIYTGSLNADNFYDTIEWEDTMLKIFEIGNWYHAGIQNYFEVIEKYVEIILDSYIICGKIDIVDKGLPIELKTISTLPVRPNIHHSYQVQAYIQALNKDKGYLTYIEKHKTDIPTRTFEIKRDDKLWKEILKKVEELHNNLNGKINNTKT